MNDIRKQYEEEENPSIKQQNLVYNVLINNAQSIYVLQIKMQFAKCNANSLLLFDCQFENEM